jgi:hypothetical protein
MLKKMMKLDHQGKVVTLAMMISGIVMSRNAQLSAMSSEIPSETKEKSIEMRMRCWVKDEIDIEAVYMPIARQILEALSHLPLVLVMDGSQAGRGCNGRRVVSEVCPADRLVGIQMQERTYQQRTAHSSIGEGFTPVARRQSGGFVGGCRVRYDRNDRLG